MTDREAAKALRKTIALYKTVNGYEMSRDSREMFEKCIGVLEALDCGDLVNRKNAVDKISRMMDYDGFMDGDCVSRRAVIGILNAI